MKKFAKKLICFTLCVLMCMSALTSCASISFRKAKKDDDKLVDKMEDAGNMLSLMQALMEEM